MIVPKYNDGWKIGIGTDTNKITHDFVNGIVVSVYRYKDYEDYYVVVLNTNGGESEVRDIFNSEFYSIETKNDVLKKSFFTYYAHIAKCDIEEYCIFVVDKDKGTVLLSPFRSASEK